MERLFLDMCEEWVEDQGSLGWGFWLSLVGDTAKEASVEWLTLVRDGIRSATAPTVEEHMSALFKDVRFALRQLIRQPAYTFTVVLLMTVGIAGNSAVFRVVNGLFLRPLPFENPEQLVDLDETAPEWDLEFLSIAYRDFDRWRAENSTFQSMAVFDGGGGNLMINGEPLRVSFLSTTHDIDEVLGLDPIMGRFYGPEEDQPDGPRGMLLSPGFWAQQFASDPDVLGTTVTLNGFPIEVIGILPREAGFLAEVDFWIPMRASANDFEGWGISGIGRLKADASIEQARADLLSIHKGMIDEFSVNEISSPVIHSLRERYLGDYALGSGFLMGAVVIVLLIACANIAGLMFARSLSRGPEMAVRLALGAPRGRIIRQLMTESLVLALIGGSAGVALGVWGSNALVVPMADQFPRWVQFDLDGSFVAFTVAVTVVAAMLFGLAPALQAAGSGGAAAGATRAMGTRKRRRALSVLVTSEVALAMMLLVVSGLSVLDVKQLGEVDPGFEPEGLISYSLSLPSSRYEDAEARLAFVDGYLPQLAAIPGVTSVTVASTLPISGDHWGWFFMAENAPPRGEDEANPVVLNRIVTSAYFETLDIEFVAGRPLDDFDGRESDNQAIVVNETFVRTHLSHVDNPVGARVTPGTSLGDNDEVTWMTVVGVTRDVKHYGVDEPMRPGVYQPLRQFPLQGFVVALRVRGESTAIISEARAITAGIDVELPIFGVETMTESLDDSLWTRRAMSWMIAAFSTVALLLAIAGIYGVISYSVGQRRQEISLRMAIGAQREDILGEVVRQGMVSVVIGVVLGLGLSLAAAGLVSGILVDVNATDLRVYGAVTLLLLTVAGLANYLPARKAAGLDPMGALRGE